MAAHKFRRLMLLYRKKLRKATWTSGGKQSGAGACAVSAFVRSGDGGRLRGRGERADCLFCRRGRADVPRTGERPYSRAKAFDAVSASGTKKETRAKGLRKGWTMARAVLQSADWELITLHMVRGAGGRGRNSDARGRRSRVGGQPAGRRRTNELRRYPYYGRFCGAGRGGHGAVHSFHARRRYYACGGESGPEKEAKRGTAMEKHPIESLMAFQWTILKTWWT